jgi:hypothetical protein
MNNNTLAADALRTVIEAGSKATQQQINQAKRSLALYAIDLLASDDPEGGRAALSMDVVLIAAQMGLYDVEKSSD